MLLRSVNLVSCALAVLSVLSCSKLEDSREAVLTNNGKGKYWDVISAKSALNRYHHLFIKSHERSNDAIDGLPKQSVFFGRNNKAMHYQNIDSIRIINPDIHAMCVKQNPDDFFFKGDSLKTEGFTYQIVFMNEGLLVLRRLYNNKEVMVIYSPSKWQEKIECKDYDCK